MHWLKKQKLKVKPISKLGGFYLIASLGFAMVSTIWAIYLESFVHNASSVGFLTSLFTATGILAYFLLIPIIEKRNKSSLLLASFLIFIISYFIFSLYSNFYLVIFLGIVLAIAASLRVTVFGIIVRDKTKTKEVSKNEGIIYTLLNFAWLIGPLIAGYLAQKYGFKSVFLASAIIIFLSALLFKMSKIKDNRKAKRIDHNIFKVSMDFFKDRDRVKAYLISGAVNFWWSLIYIYVPIRIVELGLGTFVVGGFLAGVIVPTVLSEYYFGKLVGKKGFKKMFFSGFLILGLLALLCFFLGNIYFILIALILASIGISMLEPTTEAYFFDIIKEEQRDKYYGPYNTATEMGSLLGALSPALILLFLPFKVIFIFFAIIMLFFSLFSLKIKDVFESRRN